MTRVLCLIATIPPRHASCERLLRELATQSRPPDWVILCLDGYGEMSAPACPLPVSVLEFRTVARSGPGCRWRLAEDLAKGVWMVNPEDRQLTDGPAELLVPLAADDLLINIDDDAELDEAPDFIRALVEAVEEHSGAAAAMGYTEEGRRAAPGPVSLGRLILGCGCGLVLRAGHLEGLQELAEQVRSAGGPDALGPCGDDQALVSAHLWRQGVPLFHAATGPLTFAPGTAASSQTRLRQARGERTLFEQAHTIGRITGWPLADPVVEVEEQPALSWDAELSSVPTGAVRARGAAPEGHRRVLVVDKEEPEQSGVYDMPACIPAREIIPRP